ncbi:response regulator [Flammeovirga yaeyamensis]|uniref:Response regulator n=1 Tax=Flammeovirga yaeyamensis TaxID=367791 RepID=A0AAX1N9I2_9BACT|nr:response regulator transcription factor [Flammeovirga yaeyamensis]MBB3699401.1 DNA-binding NarL/FixJ family response regulator [Flammeovirga yaeyamensis]NMF35340.1 response regulator transcription factor [Flammeovirga yaeyamensis]QWG04200.1 response regulator [Flammeovirga yaeyamensis]
MEKKINIAIIDDHKIILQGLKSMMIAEDAIKILGLYQTTKDFLISETIQQIDILLLDINLGNESGILFAKKLKKKFNDLKIIMLTAFDDDTNVEDAILVGVDAYITKDAEKDELVLSIHEVFNGRKYFGKKVSKLVFDGFIQNVKSKNEIPLSERECEVLTHIAEGLKHKEIADVMCVSVKTVETHKSNLQRKLELYTTADLVKYALKNRLIEM